MGTVQLKDERGKLHLDVNIGDNINIGGDVDILFKKRGGKKVSVTVRADKAKEINVVDQHNKQKIRGDPDPFDPFSGG